MHPVEWGAGSADLSIRGCPARGVQVVRRQWLEGHYGHDRPPSYMAHTPLFAVLYGPV